MSSVSGFPVSTVILSSLVYAPIILFVFNQAGKSGRPVRGGVVVILPETND